MLFSFHYFVPPCLLCLSAFLLLVWHLTKQNYLKGFLKYICNRRGAALTLLRGWISRIHLAKLQSKSVFSRSQYYVTTCNSPCSEEGSLGISCYLSWLALKKKKKIGSVHFAYDRQDVHPITFQVFVNRSPLLSIFYEQWWAKRVLSPLYTQETIKPCNLKYNPEAGDGLHKCYFSVFLLILVKILKSLLKHLVPHYWSVTLHTVCTFRWKSLITLKLL